MPRPAPGGPYAGAMNKIACAVLLAAFVATPVPVTAITRSGKAAVVTPRSSGSASA